MIFQESETVELKEKIDENIKKVIVSFANCKGGTVYVGIKDDGKIVGIKDIDDSMLQLSNMIRDSIRPDITMFVNYKITKTQGKQIIQISVQRGGNRPYYLAKKGLRPEGVYVRQGSSSAPASDTEIRNMIKETDGDNFEEMRSTEQNLTFNALSKEFKARNLDFGTKQKQTLKILNQDGMYTNTGLLLSEQCVHSVKAAVFEGRDQSIFKDRKEFSGSLIQQLNNIYNYIDMHNQTRSTFDKLLRIDTRDYPPSAIREALLNLLVHRDYSFSASSLISIYTDRIEFVSIGGLLPGILLEDIMLGLSVCRNKNLAGVFYRLHLIEAYGTGMSKIIGAYENLTQKPIIENTANAFKIVLPNINTKYLPQNNDKLKDTEIKIIEFIKKKKKVSRSDIEQKFDMSSSSVSRLLKSLTENGIILKDGKGKNTQYISS